jgi:putative FmdB family regulatory protein
VIIAQKSKYNGEVSLRDAKLGPRIAMRGFVRCAGCGCWRYNCPAMKPGDEMPTYEYACSNCGERFEKMMTISERQRQGAPRCPKCKSKKVEQVPAAFQAVTAKKT